MQSSVCQVSLLPAAGAETKRNGITFPVRYAGGTLALDQRKIKATVAEDEVVFIHGNERFAIPIENITAVSRGTDVRRRFGAAVLGMVPGKHFEKVETYYVGLTWTGSAGAAKAEAVFQLSNGEYRDFVALLERLTGRKAVDTDKVATVVRYEL